MRACRGMVFLKDETACELEVAECRGRYKLLGEGIRVWERSVFRPPNDNSPRCEPQKVGGSRLRRWCMPLSYRTPGSSGTGVPRTASSFDSKGSA